MSNPCLIKPSDTTGTIGCRKFAAPLSGLVAYAATSLIVILGVAFGCRFLEPPDNLSISRDFGNGISRQDGTWYKMLVAEGYTYDPLSRSPVAFFPLVPWIASAINQLTGAGPITSLLIVAHLSLAAAFVLSSLYLRIGDSDNNVASRLAIYALGVMPATLFFRMTYTESTFLMISVLFLLGIQRGWSLFTIAFIAGLASGTRPAGVGLLPPLLLCIWNRSDSFAVFLRRAIMIVPMGGWGLIVYATFLYIKFGDPLVFAKTQTHWGVPAPTVWDKVSALVTYQPIWDVFLRTPINLYSVFDWRVINPIYFVATALALAAGWRSKAINAYESLMGFSLLFIPYLTRAYEMHMASFARFAGVVFPTYIILGRWLALLPETSRTGVLFILAFLLGIYSAMFAIRHAIY